MWLTHWRIFTVFNINLSKTSNTLVCFVSKRHNSHSTLLSSGISKSTSLIKRHSGYLRKSVKKKNQQQQKTKKKNPLSKTKQTSPVLSLPPKPKSFQRGQPVGFPGGPQVKRCSCALKKGWLNYSH